MCVLVNVYFAARGSGRGWAGCGLPVGVCIGNVVESVLCLRRGGVLCDMAFLGFPVGPSGRRCLESAGSFPTGLVFG